MAGGLVKLSFKVTCLTLTFCPSVSGGKDSILQLNVWLVESNPALNQRPRCIQVEKVAIDVYCDVYALADCWFTENS